MGTATIQRELWGRHPDTWSTTLEPTMQPFYEAALGALEPVDGRTLLDAGCGAGFHVSLLQGLGVETFGFDVAANCARAPPMQKPTTPNFCVVHSGRWRR